MLFDGVERVQRILASDDEASERRLAGLEAPSIALADATSTARQGRAPRVRAQRERARRAHRVRRAPPAHRTSPQGMPLYRLRVSFALSSIDTALEDLKARARPLAELITYLPSLGGGDDDLIELEVLLASRGRVRAAARGAVHRRRACSSWCRAHAPTAKSGPTADVGAAATSAAQAGARAGRRGPSSSSQRRSSQARAADASTARAPTRCRCARWRRRCASTSASSTT